MGSINKSLCRGSLKKIAIGISKVQMKRNIAEASDTYSLTEYLYSFENLFGFVILTKSSH